MTDRSTQLIVFDSYSGIKLFEIHQNGKSLGGFDYMNQVALSREECSKLIRKLNESSQLNMVFGWQVDRLQLCEQIYF